MDRKFAFAYGRYSNERDATWELLLDYKISSLPISVSSLARQMNILICDYSSNTSLLRRSGLGSLLDAYGFAYLDPVGQVAIFYNDQRPRQEIRFTVAHELGHILLGHMKPDLKEPRGYLLNPCNKKKEQAADQFAMRLLAPACVLWGLELYTAREIAVACDIPPEVARDRARRMAVLRKRNAWLKSPLERQLYAQFGLPELRQEGVPDGNRV